MRTPDFEEMKTRNQSKRRPTKNYEHQSKKSGMLAEEEVASTSILGPTLLCENDGSFEWKPTLDSWLWLFTAQNAEVNLIWLPSIILPSMLGGGKVAMCLVITNGHLQLETGMVDDEYNADTYLPVSAHIVWSVVYLSHNTERWVSWTGNLNRSTVIVCKLDHDLINEMLPPKFKFRFTVPNYKTSY